MCNWNPKQRRRGRKGIWRYKTKNFPNLKTVNPQSKKLNIPVGKKHSTTLRHHIINYYKWVKKRKSWKLPEKKRTHYVGRSEAGAPTSYDDYSRAQQEKERLPLLAWQELSQWETITTQLRKSHGLFVYYSSPNFLYPSIKEFSSPFLLGTCMCLAMIVDPELQFCDPV